MIFSPNQHRVYVLIFIQDTYKPNILTVKEIIAVLFLHMFKRHVYLCILTVPECEKEYDSLFHIRTTQQHFHAVIEEFNFLWADIIFNIQDYHP